jgi:hypothetical protein
MQCRARRRSSPAHDRHEEAVLNQQIPTGAVQAAADVGHAVADTHRVQRQIGTVM